MRRGVDHLGLAFGQLAQGSGFPINPGGLAFACLAHGVDGVEQHGPALRGAGGAQGSAGFPAQEIVVQMLIAGFGKVLACAG